MTEQEYESKLQDLQNQIEELKKVKIEEENKIWKPKNNEEYYSILSDGMVVHSAWVNTSEDNGSYSIGNCFKTKEEAEFEKEKRIIRTKFKRYLKEHSDKIDFDCSWYCLELDALCKTIKYNCCYNYIANDYIASSEKILEDAVKFISGEEVAKKYLFDNVGE